VPYLEAVPVVSATDPGAKRLDSILLLLLLLL
jgi:hypothetical protein